MSPIRLFPFRLAPPAQVSMPTVWLIGFFAFLNVYSMQAVLPMVMHDFRASPVQAGMTVGATVLAIALVSPFMGLLSDRLGRKNIVSTALLAMTLPTGLIALAQSLSHLLVLRFLQGLAVPGITVVFIAYIAEELDATGLARTMSTFVGGTVMGGFSGRFLSGHLSDWLGWRGAFLVLALLNLAGAVLVIWRLPPSRHFVPNPNTRHAMRTLAQHLRNGRLLAACALGFCVLFSLVGAFTYVNVYLSQAPFRLSPAGLANVFGVYLLGVAVTPLAGRAVVRLGMTRALLGALALSAGGLLVTLLPSLSAVILGLAICSTGVFICQFVTISFISSSVSEGRSLANGLYYMTYYAGGAVGAWGAGIAYEAWGWGGAVATIFMVQWLAASVAWFGVRRSLRLGTHLAPDL